MIYYIIRETAIIFDEKKDPPMRQIDIARLLGHAVAYQCLSNRNGSSSWSYIWLNQGISTLLAMDAIDQVYPNYHIKDLFVVQTLQESFRLDTDSIMKPLISEVNGPSDIDSGFSFACYIKAPAILRMLQYMLGEKVFQNGIDKYLSNDPFYGMEDIKAFWISMQAAYDEQNVMYLNLKETMEAWMTREHYPVMNVTQNKTHFVVTTESTSTKESEKEWWIPYIAMVMEESNFPLSKSMRYVSMNIGHFVHVSEDWLIVNLQQIGYYRVNYNAESLKRIANYLNTDKYFKVHVLNRAQIIDDVFYFLIRGQLNLSVFMDLTMYLLMERSYIAWYSMFKAFEYMSSFFPFEESSYIKERMIKIFDKLHQTVEYEERNDTVYFSSSLQQEATRWACAFGSFKCKKQAESELKVYLMQKREIGITVILIDIINHVYSQSSLDKINIFLEDYIILQRGRLVFLDIHLLMIDYIIR
ncbi:aminopeptidase N-like [Temnothorax nylanderi]|uniref:aminopeptidase N-like n=1 Tax=Temnothorax nylanderi TaxID=102681 RepID=UPI003A85DC4D